MVWEFSSAWWKINQSEFHLHDSLFTKDMLIVAVIFNTVNNKEVWGWSVVSHLTQVQLTLLASPLCAQYSVFLVATVFV